jgi:predicted phage terminase large subunit-like protein
MLSKKQAAADLTFRRMAREHILHYIRYTSQNYKVSTFAEIVCSSLDQFVIDVNAGKRPILILQAPPQHGKSEIVSRKLPAYLMGRFPEIRIGAASYSDELANAMAQDVRRNLATPEHKVSFPTSNEKRKYDVNRLGEFTSPGGGGSYLGVGVGAGLTGRPVDCVIKGTLIDTSIGHIPVEDLQFVQPSCKILTYREGCLFYERLEAFAVHSSVGIYRITTESGRILEVTGDHPIFSGNGYVVASQLAPGQNLLCSLRKRKNNCGLRVSKEGGSVLQSEMFASCEKNRLQVFSLQNNHYSEKSQNLRSVQIECPGAHSSTFADLPDVSKGIRSWISWAGQICSVLFNRLFESSTLSPYEFDGQSEMETRSHSVAGTASFSKGVSFDSKSNCSAGQESMRALPSLGFFTCTSHRQLANEQCVCQSCNSLREMPSQNPLDDGWAFENDRVASIVRVCESAVTYDLQVENCHNFFANGVLIHNCGIIDDPVKNEKEALSPVTKEGHWNWYQSVFTTRLSENSGQIIMATSWAEDDLPARIINQYRGDPRLTHLAFPAINSPKEVGYNPALAEGALVPQLHSLEKLLEQKGLMSEYWWSALYQQRAKALGGNVFKQDGVQFYLPKDLPKKFDKVIISWDCTFKDTDGTDFVVGQVWGKAGANSYLLDQIRKRMSFTATLKAVIALKEKWSNAWEILIEDKANGPAVIDTLKTQVPGILPIEPDGSKLARAHAVTSYWEALNIWLPHPDIAPWIGRLDGSHPTDSFLGELTAFPAAAHDDQVDSMTQALRRLYPLFGKLAISQAAINAALGIKN